MTIQILGAGCAKCKQLTENVEAAARELGLDYQLEKVSGILQIIQYGVMATPALVVDAKVKLGKVATSAEILELLRQTLNK